MKITKIDIVRTTKPIPLPGPYRPAWTEPDGAFQTDYAVAYCRIFTDEGIVGYGPYSADADEFIQKNLLGTDPFLIEKFFNLAMTGIEPLSGGTYGGFDVALWDIIGKAAGLPVYKILGSCENKIKVYAATSRLCTPEEHVRQVQHICSLGFKAVKLRMHRPDYRDDIRVIEAVRKVCGNEIQIVVDANQNNPSNEYNFWSMDTSRTVGRELQNLDVYFYEEPRKRSDYRGLAKLAKEFDMYIAGGEHSRNIYEFKNHLKYGAYDILQPDLILGNIGITGIRKLGHIAEFYDKKVIPHVCGLGSFALSFASTAAAVSGLSNCPMLEFPYDPPYLSTQTQQFYIKNKFEVDKDGYVALPQIPGIGVEIDEEAISHFI